MAADAGRARDLVEPDVVGELVAQQLGRAPQRGITTGGAAAVVDALRAIADVAQPVGEQRLALQRPRRRLERPVQLHEPLRQPSVAHQRARETEVQRLGPAEDPLKR